MPKEASRGRPPQNREVETRFGFWDASTRTLKGASRCEPQKHRTLYPDIAGYAVRSSTRWFLRQNWPTYRRPIPLPYIQKSGKLSMSAIAIWNAYPEQIVASVSSTVYLRLKKLLTKRHGKKNMTALRDVTFRCASLYAITHNDWLIDRFLGILRRKPLEGKKVVKKLLHSVLCNLGENERFVYNQIYFQISWLTFRSKRPRDKPKANSYWLLPPKPDPFGEGFGGQTTILPQPKGRRGSAKTKVYPAFMDAARTWLKVEWHGMKFEYQSDGESLRSCEEGSLSDLSDCWKPHESLESEKDESEPDWW